MRDIDSVKMDKTHFSVVSMHDESDAKDFWQTQTPEQRLAAAEVLRQITYGYDPDTERLQRLLEIVECKWG